jgi:hypothetical protein
MLLLAFIIDGLCPEEVLKALNTTVHNTGGASICIQAISVSFDSFV